MTPELFSYACTCTAMRINVLSHVLSCIQVHLHYHAYIVMHTSALAIVLSCIYCFAYKCTCTGTVMHTSALAHVPSCKHVHLHMCCHAHKCTCTCTFMHTSAMLPVLSGIQGQCCMYCHAYKCSVACHPGYSSLTGDLQQWDLW